MPLADIYGQDKGTLDHTTFLFSRQYLLSHGLRYPEGMTILEDSVFVLRCLATNPVVRHNATYRFSHIHTRHATQGRWESARRQAFLPDIEAFFQAFRQYAESHGHARTLYDRYLYVYLRVLLVKFCTWRELMLFRQQAGPYLGHASLQRRLMRCRLSYAMLFVARRMLFLK